MVATAPHADVAAQHPSVEAAVARAGEQPTMGGAAVLDPRGVVQPAALLPEPGADALEFSMATTPSQPLHQVGGDEVRCVL